MRHRIHIVAMAGTAAAALALAGQSTGATAGSKSARTITYVYGTMVELAPGKDVYAEAVCPAGTFAVGGGFTQFDESKPEDEGTNPDVVVSFAGVNSVAAPPKFVPRRFEVVFRNTGTSTTTVGAARATCMPAAHTKLATAKG